MQVSDIYVYYNPRFQEPEVKFENFKYVRNPYVKNIVPRIKNICNVKEIQMRNKIHLF